ncbi:MAG: aspartate aminotransferase family protein [Oscillospiraceae bacterium]|nr:aspartate aminotransferase family protein [Oscillospiraceae bacterium]
MTHDEIMQQDQQYIIGTYARYPVVLSHGKNATLYDIDGTEYIDFMSGIGVNALGAADEEWINAVTESLHKISHISNYYYSPNTCKTAQKLVELSGMNKVFFGNSGAEANEGAIKTARKYSFDKYGENRSTIISLVNSFHGRTITTLAATGQDDMHKFFYPFTEGFKYAPLNDIDKLNEILTPDVCAILAEPIQGEGGVNIMTDEYAIQLRKICDDNDLVLIFDEIQTGIARTGKMFAYEHFGFKPDIMTLAKGLGGGLPIGVFVVGEKCEKVLGLFHHGTTFGANPVIVSGAYNVLSRVSQPEFLNEVCEKGKYIRQKIAEMKIPIVKEIRGKGLMIGIQIDGTPKDYTKKGAANGLLLLTAGTDVIRMLPPLTITYDEIDKGLSIFKGVIS